MLRPTSPQRQIRSARLVPHSDPEADSDLVDRGDSDITRPDFAVQLATVRATGTFFADPTDVPDVVVALLTRRLKSSIPTRLSATRSCRCGGGTPPRSARATARWGSPECYFVRDGCCSLFSSTLFIAAEETTIRVRSPRNTSCEYSYGTPSTVWLVRVTVRRGSPTAMSR